MEDLKVQPIGTVQNNDSGAFIEVEAAYIPALQALEGFGHVNVLWWFSKCDTKEARSILEAPQPYKGAPEIMGTFATRSPLRPNPIALSTTEIIAIDQEKGVLRVGYIDAEDGTPVLDIKPYTPSMDRVETPRVPAWCSHWPRSIETSGDFEWEEVFNF